MCHVHSYIILGQLSQHRPHFYWDSVHPNTGIKETLVVLPAVRATVNTSSTDTLVAASSIYFTLLGLINFKYVLP